MGVREIPCRRARRTFRLRIPENTHITSNTHPRPFSQCSPHRLFGGGGTSRSRSGACRGWITVFARMYVLLRPSALPAPGLPSHISSVSETGRATLFVCRAGHAVPSAFVSDAVSLCSVCCLTSSPASPRRLDRSAAPGGSVRVPPVCLEDGPRASPRAVQPEYLSGMGRRTSPHGSSSRTLIQSSHAESSRFV